MPVSASAPEKSSVTTVDWSNWLALTDAQRRALLAKYRTVIKDESDHARFTNYAMLDLAIRDPYRILERRYG